MKKLILFSIVFCSAINQLSAGWDQAYPINNYTQAGAQSAQYPKISHDNFGNAISVWIENDGSNDLVKTSTYNYNVGWTDALFIPGQVSNPSSGVQISHDKYGNAMAIWIYNSNVIDYSKYTYATSTWSNASALFGPSTNVYTPQVKHDIFGNAHVVWIDYNGSNYRVMAGLYDFSSSSWQLNVVISANDTNGKINPKISCDPLSGNAICVWEEWDGAKYIIKYSRYDFSTGSWSAAAAITNTGQAGNAASPEIVYDAYGRAFCVWYEGASPFSIIKYSVRTVAGVWVDAEQIPNVQIAGNAFFPKIDSDIFGNVICVWREGIANHVVRANRYTIASGWELNASFLGSINGSSEPQLSMDIFGNAACVWHTSGSPYDEIQTARYVNGTGWQTYETLSNPSQAGNAWSQKISHDPWGNAIAVWQELDATGKYIIKYDHYMHNFEPLILSHQDTIVAQNASNNYSNLLTRVIRLENLVSQRPIVRRDGQDFFEEDPAYAFSDVKTLEDREATAGRNKDDGGNGEY